MRVSSGGCLFSFVLLLAACGSTTSDASPDASSADAASDTSPARDASADGTTPRTCGANADGGRCVANGVSCGVCEGTRGPDDSECGAGFTCCLAEPFGACHDAGHDASDGATSDASADDGGAQVGCTSTGGTVVSKSCCASAGDFPNECGIGACSCAPSSSHAIQACACPSGKCFDGTKCK